MRHGKIPIADGPNRNDEIRTGTSKGGFGGEPPEKSRRQSSQW